MAKNKLQNHLTTSLSFAESEEELFKTDIDKLLSEGWHIYREWTWSGVKTITFKREI